VIERELAFGVTPAGVRFLDFGCGTGESSPSCFPPEHYTGVDLAPHYLRYAGRKLRRQLCCHQRRGDRPDQRSLRCSAGAGRVSSYADTLVRATVAELPG
jgi:hypothetical protein